jgi:hypothetical protein
MQMFETLACAFFKTFGITQPTEHARRRAAWFILMLLILALIAVCAIGGVFYHLMHL